MRKGGMLGALISCILLTQTAKAACILDQNQPTYDGGTSERNLAGYYEWESFTAGVTGQLCEIDLLFCNSSTKLNGTGTLKIYTGTGTVGTLLTTQTVTVNGTSYATNTVFWQQWTVTVPPSVTATQVYTFQFIPTVGGGLPDPYLIEINIPNVYAGGHNYNLGTAGCCAFKTYVTASVLPIQMLSFTGKNKEDANILNWSTAAEVNNDHFIIERSSNGVDYTEIGQQKGAGNSSTIKDYQYIDAQASLADPSILYYRLKQVDMDGGYQYYGPVPIEMNAPGNLQVALQNIPTKNELMGIIESPLGEEVQVEIYDMQGQRLITRPMTIAKGANNFNVDLQNIASGIYMLRISGSSVGQVTKKFAKL